MLGYSMLNRLLKSPRCITNLGSISTSSFHRLAYTVNLSTASPTRQQKPLSIASSVSSDEIKRWNLAWDDLIGHEKARIAKSNSGDPQKVQNINSASPGQLQTAEDVENKIEEPKNESQDREDEIADRKDKIRDREDEQSPWRTSDYSSKIEKSQSFPLSNDYRGGNGEQQDQDDHSRRLPELVSLNAGSGDSGQEQKYPATPISLGAGCYGTDSIKDRSKKTAEMLEPIDKKWIKGFRKINSVYDGKWYPSKTDSTPLSPSLTFKCWPLYLNRQARRNRGMRGLIIQLWRKTNRTRIWRQSTLLWALRNDQHLAIFLLGLEMKRERPRLPRLVINDSLDQLACVDIFSADGGAAHSTHFRAIFWTACLFLAKYGKLSGSASLSQRTILILTKRCTRKQLMYLIPLLKKYRSGLHTSTRLQIMRRCVSFGEVDTALSLLQNVPTLELSMDKVQSCCVGLLRANLATEDLYSLRTQILTYILEIGIRPNRQMSNVIMLNAAEAGDLSTAWHAHEIAEENGLTPDEYSYAILLKGAQHGDSKDRIQRIYENAKKAGLFSKSSRLGFELLYAVFLTENGTFDSSPYTALLPLYQEFFDTSSLRALGLPVGHEAFSLQPLEVREPTTQALALMLRAWLQQYCVTGPVQEVYERYMHGVRNGHAEISKLAETTYTNNAFIVAFSKSGQNLALCTTVVQNMLKPPGSTSEKSLVATDSAEACVDKPPDPKNAIRVALPDVQTWSILLFAFVCNGKPKAAERVLTIMKHRCCNPNQVTWNSLLNHYTRAQDIHGVVNAVERMEADGFNTNNYTIKALGQVVDLPRLIEAFEKASARHETRSMKEPLSEESETRADSEEKAQAVV